MEAGSDSDMVKRMPYKLTDLLIESGLAANEQEALALARQTTINGHSTEGLTNPLVKPDDTGKIKLEANGKKVTVKKKGA